MALELIKLVKGSSAVAQVGSLGFFKLSADTGGGGDLTFSRVFSENTPQQISAVSDEISANNMTSAQIAETYGWNIGDTIDITLSSAEVIQMRITGFNHDNKTDGSGTAGITLEMTHLLSKRYRLNNSLTCRPYTSTEMYTTTLPNIKSTLPIEWQNVIKPVDKIISGYSGVYSMDLFLLGEIELTGTNNVSNYKDGVQYEYWVGKTAEDRIKDANNWWLRSSFSSNRPCVVAGVGGSVLQGQYNKANSDYGVSFAFCV